MKLVSKLTVCAALALATTLSAGLATPAAAQKKGKDKAADMSKYKPQLSPPFQKVIVQVQAALTAKNTAEAATKLAEAQALATTPDDKYYVGAMRQNLAVLNNKDVPTLKTAFAEKLASGSPLVQQEAGPLSRQLGMWAHDDSKNYAEAIRLLTEADRLGAADGSALIYLSDSYAKTGKMADSFVIAKKAIAAEEKAGAKAPAQWFYITRNNAFKAGAVAEVTDLSIMVMQAYPTPENMHDAAAFFINAVRPADQARLDAFRFMRAAKAMNSEYSEIAELLLKLRLPGEAKAVLDEGLAAGILKATSQPVKDLQATLSGQLAGDRASLAASEKLAKTKTTGAVAANVASAYLGYGEYAKAIEFFKLAILMGGIDKDEATLRLGMAQLGAGSKSEAAQTFATVGGSRTELGKLWRFLASR